MNYRIITSLFLLLPLLFGNNPAPQAAPANQDATPPVVKEAAGPYTDVTIHGNMWQAERRYNFLTFSPKGWGTYTKLKAAGYEWVQISVPIMSQMESRWQYVTYAEFCAKSSNGAVTKPVTLTVYNAGTMQSTQSISWPADNAMHCIGHTYSPSVWFQDLGISVNLYFANSTDVITMYKAWAQSSD